MVAERKCSIEGCDKKHKGNTYCSKHNQKFKKYGDPLGEHPNETKRKQRIERLEKLALEGMKECFNCEHTVTGLQNQKMYDVAVRAVYAKGLGYLSNDLISGIVSNTLLCIIAHSSIPVLEP